MPDAPVILREADRIAHLVLNAPPRNEMNRCFFDALLPLLTEVLPKLDVDGVMVHGSGRHFSSGADVEELKDSLRGPHPRWNPSDLLRTTRAFQTLEDLPIPVVAAISGCCFGSAAELAIACDIRIAVGNALIALPETSFGLLPGCGGTIRLGELVGCGRAAELILSGRILSAQAAEQIGLVDLVVEKTELLECAATLIRRLHGTREVGT